MLLPKRIWKDIEGFEGFYQVSNDGKVRSLDRYVKGRNGKKRRIKGKILKPIYNKHKCGYVQVVASLCKDSKPYYLLVNRLVAKAFIPNPNNLTDVNHKDENPLNNHVRNLEWMSHKDNCNYGTRNERCSKSRKGKLTGEKHPRYGKRGKDCPIYGKNRGKDNVHAKPVLMFDLDGNFIKRWDCIADAEEECNPKHNRNANNIRSCCKGRQSTSYGYIWKLDV